MVMTQMSAKKLLKQWMLDIFIDRTALIFKIQN